VRAPPVQQREEAPAEDGQGGGGNTYRTLLAAAGQSPEGWAAFRNAVLAEPALVETSAWVRHWDADMTVQTARRASMPPHYSTGALDPHIAAVHQQLERPGARARQPS
jgi:hypothetical protein